MSVISFERGGVLVRGVGQGGRGGCGAVGAAAGHPSGLERPGREGAVVPQAVVSRAAPFLGSRDLLVGWRWPGDSLSWSSPSVEGLIWTRGRSWPVPSKSIRISWGSRVSPDDSVFPASPPSLRSLGDALSHPTVVDSDSVILMSRCSTRVSPWVCTCCQPLDLQMLELLVGFHLMLQKKSK